MHAIEARTFTWAVVTVLVIVVLRRVWNKLP
jgi:hypothetical protein